VVEAEVWVWRAVGVWRGEDEGEDAAAPVDGAPVVGEEVAVAVEEDGGR